MALHTIELSSQAACMEGQDPGGEKKGSTTETEDDNEPIPHLHAKTFLAVFAVCLIYFAQVVNIVGAGAQTLNIITVLDPTSRDGVWLTSVIAIMTVVLSPITSQAADYWGRRYLLISLTLCGAIGSLIIARANSIGTVIAGFTVTGLSYGAQPLVHTVASEVLPRKHRPWAQAADNVSAALGALVGLLAGGALTRHGHPEGFRNFWYMVMAIYLLATLLTIVLYNPPPSKNQTDLELREKLAKLDWVGYFLLSAGLILFCMGLSWSQNPYLWSDAHPTAPFVLGVALISGFVVYESKFKADGMVHHGLFSTANSRNLPIALLCIFLEGLVFFAANNYFIFQLSVLYQTDSFLNGVQYGINCLAHMVSTTLAGLYCSMTKRIRWPTAVAFCFLLIFFVCMATSGTSTSKPLWAYPMFLGFGLGTCLCSLVTIAQLSTPKELISTTSGLMIGIRSLGGSVGLAIYGAIFSAVLEDKVGSNVSDAVLSLGLPASSLKAFISALQSHSTSALLAVPGVTPAIIEAGANAFLEAYSSGFRFVWVSACCFTALGAIAAVFLVDPRKEFTMAIDAPAEKEDELYSL